MQGFIHLLLEAYIGETLGAQQVPEIRRQAGIDGPPLATQPYPDQLINQMVQAIAAAQGLDPDKVLYNFGVYFMNAPLVERNYAAFLEGHTSAQSFLKSVPGIHSTLQNSLKGAYLPEIRYVEHDANLLEIIYESPRRLCSFLLGILAGVGRRFNEPVEAHEMECQLRGARACRVLVRTLPARRSGPLPVYPVQTDAPLIPIGARASSGPLPAYPSAIQALPNPNGRHTRPGTTRKREQEEDLLVLQMLAGAHPTPAQSPPTDTPQRPLALALSVFEITQRLAASGLPPEHVRLSVVQRSLMRLAVLGFIESKLDAIPRDPGGADALAFGGGGVLAAQRYRITPAGETWLRETLRKQNR